MKKFEVTFYYSDDTYHKSTFESNDIVSLIKLFNEKRFIHLPGNIQDNNSKKWRTHTIINMDNIWSISIDEILYEDNTWMEKINKINN